MSTSALPPAVTAPTTLVVLLGASAWPYSPKLEASGAFVHATHEFKKYLLDPRGFGLPGANLLDLFDEDLSSTDQLIALRTFLKERTGELLATGQTVRDVLIYFVGHGDFAGPSLDFYLLPRWAETPILRTTGLRVDALAEILREEVRFTRRYLVLDCCFAGAAFHLFQGGADHTAIAKTAAAFRRFPTRGSALLYSSDQDTPSLRLPDGSSTTFSFALLEALRNGDPEHNHPLSLRALTRLVQEQVVMLREKKGTENTPFPAVVSLDQSDGGDVADVPFFPNPSIPRKQIIQAEEEQRELTEKEETTGKEIYLHTNPIKITIRGMRLLACGIVFIFYWLTIGYMTRSIFPEKLLKISGSTYLMMSLLGNDKKTQIVKATIIVCSLTIDWLLFGILISRLLDKSLFPLPYALISWIAGIILIAVLLFLIRLQTSYDEKKFRYNNIINLRKAQAVVFATSLLILFSQFFGASFLYFPIAASVFSLGLFFYDLIGLGGASYSDELTGLNPIWDDRLRKQQENTARSKVYFDNREKKKNAWKSIFID